MFWRSVVGKLAISILLLVSFVLFILTILLLEFFEGFHVQEAEKAMMQTATKITSAVEELDEKKLIYEMTERVKDPTNLVIIYFEDGELWTSNTTNEHLTDLAEISPTHQPELMKVIEEKEELNVRLSPGFEATEIMVIGTPLETKDGAIFVYQ